MERPRSAGEGQLLTQLLLDRHDVAAGIALACLLGDEAKAHRGEADPSANGNTRTAPVELVKVELEVIGWAAAGKSYPDIAVIMDMPYGTVRYHLDQARRRNGFDTVMELIVRAARDYDLNPLAG